MPKATNIILLHIRQNCPPGSSNREAVVKVSSLKIPTPRSIVIGIRGASWAPKVQSVSSSEVNDHQRVQWIFNLEVSSACAYRLCRLQVSIQVSGFRGHQPVAGLCWFLALSERSQGCWGSLAAYAPTCSVSCEGARMERRGMTIYTLQSN